MGATELAALNTGAQEGVAADYAKASRSLNNQLAVRGGGSEVLPTGSRDALKGQLASAAANESSRQSQAITEANYNLGRQNWQQATAGLTQLGQLYNPTPFASLAQSGNNDAFQMSNQINQQKNQKTAAIAGGLASLGLDAATFGMGGLAAGGGIGGFLKGGLNALGGKFGLPSFGNTGGPGQYSQNDSNMANAGVVI